MISLFLNQKTSNIKHIALSLGRLKRFGAVGVLLTIQGCATSFTTDVTPLAKQEAPAQNKADLPKATVSSAPNSTVSGNTSIAKTAKFDPTPSSDEASSEACWVQATIYPKRIVTPLEIVTRDSVNDIQVDPAVIRPEQRAYTVRQGSKTFRVEPPTYKQVTERELVREEIRRTIVVPAVFETRVENIEIESERKLLVPCATPGSRKLKAPAAQSMCTHTQPARFKTLTRKVLTAPETVREEIEPAIYKNVKLWVVDTPARVIELDIPEKTGLITVQTIVTPERIDERQLPPLVVNIESIKHDGVPRPVWRQTLCPKQANEDLIKRMQSALDRSGHSIADIDGKLGKKTLHAMQAYQLEHGLASGSLTLETLQHLGVLGSASPP